MTCKNAQFGDMMLLVVNKLEKVILLSSCKNFYCGLGNFISKKREGQRESTILRV